MFIEHRHLCRRCVLCTTCTGFPYRGIASANSCIVLWNRNWETYTHMNSMLWYIYLKFAHIRADTYMVPCIYHIGYVQGTLYISVPMSIWYIQGHPVYIICDIYRVPCIYHIWYIQGTLYISSANIYTVSYWNVTLFPTQCPRWSPEIASEIHYDPQTSILLI
jgi:hypothetical protein